MAQTGIADGTGGPTEGSAVPIAARWLGGTGALPFVALLAVTVFGAPGWSEWAGQALALYGAVILSFLGGIQWGLAIASSSESEEKRGPRLAISVVPSLIGWAALLLPLEIGLYVLAAAFALVLFLDAQATMKGEAPAWYPKLRLPLTAVVMTSLVVGALFTAI
ncbi:DUF3429 domain-containing protein [Labrenzia sp. VG12]|uniref:DUF3429 domain-containing protein n=1 Tax=Labrenzia sp. VG12 TaxID=2021862 RepID=UPI000B8C29A4|nr:DUF3429 domain-containing protein [Labrenzia sp. VG12]ASP35715.1 DUF3429 domain-containing protein [Labrenzia sp. VG12]